MKYDYYKERDNSIEGVLTQIKMEATPLDTGSFYLISNVSRTELDYLKELELIDSIESVDDAFGIGLTTKGVELIAYYETWEKYKKRVIERKKKVDDARNLAQRFWWLPIIISALALGVSIWVLFRKQ